MPCAQSPDSVFGNIFNIGSVGNKTGKGGYGKDGDEGQAVAPKRWMRKGAKQPIRDVERESGDARSAKKIHLKVVPG